VHDLLALTPTSQSGSSNESDHVPLNAADRLPYDKRLLEDLAARVVGTVMNAPAIIRRDRGQRAQVHDFDVIDNGRDACPVEVTMVTNNVQLRRRAAIRQYQARFLGLTRRWNLLLSHAPEVRISALTAELPKLLDDLESGGISYLDTRAGIPDDTRISARLAFLGITEALGAPAQGGNGELHLRHPPLGDAGPDPVTRAVEAAARLRDNTAKLASAGGGELFVWITDSHPAHGVIWDQTSITTQRPPRLPEPIRVVWAAWLFSHTDQAGNITASCDQLWRATSGAPWEDRTAQALKQPLVLNATPPD
jgi:hypothetical protein